MEEDSDLGLWPWGPRSMGIFCRVGSIVPSVSALWPGVLGEEHRLGFFLPKSSAPVTEEIIVFVERLNLVERSKCTFSPPLSPGPLPILPGLGAANTWNVKSLPRVHSQLGLGLRGRNWLVTSPVL